MQCVLQHLEVKIGSPLEAWCSEEPLSALKGFRSTPYTLRTGFGILQLTHRIHTQEYYDNFNMPFTGGIRELTTGKNKVRPQRNLEKRSSEGDFDPAGCGVMC